MKKVFPFLTAILLAGGIASCNKCEQCSCSVPDSDTTRVDEYYGEVCGEDAINELESKKETNQYGVIACYCFKP